MDSRVPTLLLVGPTGSGKSPLGRILERLSGWVHLDFGELLREIAAGEESYGLSGEECDFVRGLLRENALFPDDAFALVGTVLESFLAKRGGPAGRPPGLVLNGLPRHLSQAVSLSAYVDVRRVAFLNASPEIVRERVARRRRGESSDHAGRDDDSVTDIQRKLAIFEERPRPLLAHYARQGVPVIELMVGDVDEDQLALAQSVLDGDWM